MDVKSKKPMKVSRDIILTIDVEGWLQVETSAKSGNVLSALESMVGSRLIIKICRLDYRKGLI